MKDVCQQRITASYYTVRFALNGGFDYPSTACPPYKTSESGRSGQVDFQHCNKSYLPAGLLASGMQTVPRPIGVIWQKKNNMLRSKIVFGPEFK